MVESSVSCDTSTRNAAGSSSTTVRQQPSTAMLSPMLTSDKSRRPASIITLAPRFSVTTERTRPVASTIPVNMSATSGQPGDDAQIAADAAHIADGQIYPLVE